MRGRKNLGMRIGILVTSIGNPKNKGFYNSQEIGLAKEMDKLFEEVIVYKAVSSYEKKQKILIEGCRHSVLFQIPVKNYGNNGILGCKVMDATLDALIYFSDTQLAVPKVYKWCLRHNVKLFPYIGVIESHSTNRVKKCIINFLFRRNVSVYRNCICFAKTAAVVKQLEELGIKDKKLTPVGLDETLLFTDYQSADLNELRTKYGYCEADKVIVFIGRMVEEKQPFRMVEILSELRKEDQNFKLLMIGMGELREKVYRTIREKDLENQVRLVDRIPNCDIWEVYRIAYCFVNLNQHEIFGMAILEAMYYGCKVVAWRAPGPSLIIENGVTGWLAESNTEIIDGIKNKKEISFNAHARVVDNFIWGSTANKMAKYMEETYI